MNRTARHIILITLLLLMGGTAMAQNDPQYVIKKGDDFLAHVVTQVNGRDTIVLQNASGFNPTTCLWYSGPSLKNNYYVMDGTNRRYLYAPLTPGATLSLSSSNPGTQVLNTTSGNYYFYAWDHGVARGVQHPMGDCQGTSPALPNGLNPNGNQCWEVVWVSYVNNGWKMSTAESYSIILNQAALQHKVTTITHDEEISNESGGITGLTLNNLSMEYFSSPLTRDSLDGTASNYSYDKTIAYTSYGFEAISVHEVNPNNSINDSINIEIPEEFHYYYTGSLHDTPPTSETHQFPSSSAAYLWTITGDGATYLSFSDSQNITTSTSAKPVLWYRNPNNTDSHKQATITFTVTYQTGVTQTRTFTVTAKTQCQNPTQAAAPVVKLEGVTVSWLPTADSYTVSWRKTSGGPWSSASVGNVTSYTITNLEGETEYEYKVKADCCQTEPTDTYTFTTLLHNAVILGSVFGGGRMADVTGTTEVIIVNCDSIGAVYGGNDIAGTVRGAGGSNVILGVANGDAYASSYDTTDANIGIRIGSVYGGGNGYYAYNGTSIEQAVYSTTYHVANGTSIMAFTPLHPEGEAVWTNNSGVIQDLIPPSIPKANITVASDYVKIDSLFGGAKNANLSNTDNDVNITVNGGTIATLFGGNNFGGSLGYHSQENITVNKTTVKTSLSDYQAGRLGRDFGIGYLFGGGNKVEGRDIEITINGGQMDTVFGGGNAADVSSALVTVNCELAAANSGTQFGNVYSNAISSCTSSGTPPTYALTIKDENDYKWEGNGIYNIRTLFGGNNRASMAGVPTLNLSSGSIGTVYGGGNAGDMMAQATDDCTSSHGELVINDNHVKYSTHVKMDSANILIDYLYGGCQMSNVFYSTWVEINNGHVGTVYGGCNISGDVGSTRIDLDATPFVGGVANEDYQKVYGAPYVVASGGTVYKNIFAGSNGLYHCKSSDNIYYVSGINYDPNHSYVGMTVPTHNETYVIVKDSALVKGNVYAGGNMASVGFKDAYESFPENVGLASVRMSGGTVDGNVFGGGNMASIFGSNEVQVSGGSIGVRLGGALYGGNDRLGDAGSTSNRVMPSSYNTASDNITSLIHPEGESDKVRTYVGVTGNPTIHTVYGGGNGAYKYSGPEADMQYCDTNNKPIQTNIFVDIAIDGGDTGGHIENVYGGGNGVSAIGFIKVFLNVQNCTNDTRNHVDTIYGGNNMGHLAIVPDIILLNGNVHTVYGGCNSGAMAATDGGTKSFTIDGTTYSNIGSFVHLRNTYPGLVNNVPTPVKPTAKVTGAVYGGCRMNSVTNNSLVFVEGGNHSTASFYGGSDISGDVAGVSYVVVNGSYENSVYDGIVGDVYGGGNGNYDYTSGTYEGKIPPYCPDARVLMLGGQAANLYGGGYAGECGATNMQVEDGLVTGGVFGGGNRAGVVKSHNVSYTTLNSLLQPTIDTNNVTSAGTSTVTMNDGTVQTGIYGGCNYSGDIAGDVVVNINNGHVGAAAVGTEGQTGYVPEIHANIHGGGYGQSTNTLEDVEVNIGDASATDSPIIYGDIYGGSALGSVNTDASNTTTVNILNGSITGDVYGGGLGHYEATVDSIAALVNGKTYVNIGADESTGNISLNGSVYGCNNLYGSPQDDVFVNIYKTAHTTGEHNNTYPSNIATVSDLNTNADTMTYAIAAVYGGGNLASYTPKEDKKTTVHVYGCANTIEDVYGGGNAANVGLKDSIATNTFVIIDGGRFNRVFNGGNGEVSPANIYGTATTTVNGGLINQVFGGGNMNGSIDSTSLILDHPSGACGDEIFAEVFGGGNLAPFSGNLTTTIACGVGTIGDIYGGSNLANIDGDVTLTIRGGDFKDVYGGSKGQLPSNSADIDGNVTLNLEGGSIKQAFGGSNTLGNITGKITVNVLDTVTHCGLNIDTVYGGGNMAAYQPTYDTILSPEVNILNGKVNRVVFGGGKGADAVVHANPCVTVSDIANDSVKVMGDVYGGGNLASVTGNTWVTINAKRATDTIYNVFGGGNQAGIDGNTRVDLMQGKVITGIYGGCNSSGNIQDTIELNIIDGTWGTATNPLASGIFGGGFGESTTTTGDVFVNIGGGGHTPTIYSNVYGGSALGNVGASGKLTKVWLQSGTINGRIYGGGLGDQANNIAATVSSDIQVDVDGGTVTTAVYGCNDQNGSPEGTVKVNINNGTVANVLGGGNQADYTGTPEVTINDGTVQERVIGGGNAADVGGTLVTINGGTFGTGTGESRGVYGGCNASGTVDGDIALNVNGGTFGCQDSVNVGKLINIFGGGYGESTRTTGNIRVNYGDITSNTHLTNPLLYGDLYGGSALGSVNTNSQDSTIVNLLNGSFGYYSWVGADNIERQYGGSVYGGGLGLEGTSNVEKGQVNGKIFVNVGEGPGDSPKGETDLQHCNVYGCNNTNGSPQDSVFVHVYKSYRISGTNTVNDLDFSIGNVFGGGNRANYAPPGTNNHTEGAKAYVRVHGCENTIDVIHGGGNAADAVGVVTIVEGGHFRDIFGGGNGQVSPANIGTGGIGLAVLAGQISYSYAGCDVSGDNYGGNYPPTLPEDTITCGALVIETYFFGANQAEIYENLYDTIHCDQDTMIYKEVYAGSRLATIYGDIYLVVRGGDIGKLYGGSRGSREKPAHIRKYPTPEQLAADPDSTIYSAGIRKHMETHGSLAGQGGNIYVKLEGGTIGDVFGGCNLNGNVEGIISIIADSTQSEGCNRTLVINNIYGGSDQTSYRPDSVLVGGVLQPVASPSVYVKNAKVTKKQQTDSQGQVVLDENGDPIYVGGNVFGGGNIGNVTSNPIVTIGNKTSTTDKSLIEGDVYGGGNQADVIGSTNVTLQGNAEINGNVFGGGYAGDVNGSTNVTIVPVENNNGSK